jgi:hypothetical protein
VGVVVGMMKVWAQLAFVDMILRRHWQQLYWEVGQQILGTSQ